jgi:hypothetical protein
VEEEEEDAPQGYEFEGAQRAEAASDAGGGGRGAACSAASISTHACMAHERAREANEREGGGGKGGAQLEHQEHRGMCGKGEGEEWVAHKLEEEALLEEEAGAARAHAHAVEAVQATHIASINWAGDCKMRHVRIDKHLGSRAHSEDPHEPATDKGAQRARAATAAAPPSAAADASAGACREHTAADASAGACGEHTAAEHTRGAHTCSTQKRSYISPPELHREICRRVRLLSFTAQFPCFTCTHAQTLDA